MLRRRLRPLRFQCSLLPLHSSVVDPCPPPRHRSYLNVPSSNINVVPLAWPRGAAARALTELRARRPLLRLHSTFEGHVQEPRQSTHGGTSSPGGNAGPPRGAESAQAVFDERSHRDAVSRCIRARDLPRAEALYRAAPASARGLHLDSVMLDGYVRARRIDRAREFFDRMPVKNVGTWSCMLSGYTRAGRVEEARQLFDTMPVRDVVSWTAMVQCYASNRMLLEAKELFDRMPERNVVAWTVMVKAFVDCDRIWEAWDLFNRMPERNLYTWNVVIFGFLSSGKVDEAVRLFESMPQRNVISWTIMVTGLAKNGFSCRAREFFDRMPQKDTAAWNAMIAAHANSGDLNEAQKLFDSMPAKNLASWKAIIDAYANPEHKAGLVSIFLLMRRSVLYPNSSTVNSILVKCESTIEVKQIHGLVITSGLLSETSLGNSLVTMYSKSGDLLSARLVFKSLEEKDAITWTSIMQAFAIHGCVYHALQAFAQMLRRGYKPSSTTFTVMLSACRHAGFVEKGRNTFKSIQHVYGIEPTVEHYSCIVDLLGRAGYVREAKELVDGMQQVMCDETILGTLLGACMMHNEVEIAREVGEELVRFSPSDAGRHTILANVFASRGMSDETANVWKIIRGAEVKKTPGFSQIEANMENNVFYSSDQEHPQCAKIYEMLNDTLVPQMKGSPCLGVWEPILSSGSAICQKESGCS